jgi:hypothetical protein
MTNLRFREKIIFHWFDLMRRVILDYVLWFSTYLRR